MGIFDLILLYFVLYLRFEFGKNANSFYVNIGMKSILRNNCLATVKVCVFHALASAGAFFYFTKLKGFADEKTQQKK